jgi:hypothetical protein
MRLTRSHRDLLVESPAGIRSSILDSRFVALQFDHDPNVAIYLIVDQRL